MALLYKPIYGFSGINRNVSDFLPEDTEYAEAQNLTTYKIGVLKKTGDYQIKGSQIAASQDILGGIGWKRVGGTSTHLVACNGASNADIYVYGTDWSTQSQSLTAGSKVRFTYSPTLDVLFAANFSDATRQYDGSAWSTTTNLDGAPKAKYPIMFGRRLYLLNVDLSGTTYPERAYRSSLVDSGSLTWDTTNEWFTFDDVINGAGKQGENMFVGCENSCHILTKTDERYQVTSIGCVSHESIASYGSWVFWAARDGMYAFDGGTDQKISLPVQEYWDAIPLANLDDIQAKVLGHHLYIYIGDVTVGGRSLSNVLFDYDILQNDWNRVSLGTEAKHLHTYITTSGERLFMGDNNGKVYEMFASESQDTAAFSSFLETNWFYGSGSRYKDDFHELWAYGNKLSGLKVSYKVDDKDWQPIGELNGFQDVIKFRARGYRIKFLLQEYSQNNLFEIHQLEVGYLPKFIGEKGNEL